MPRQRFERLLGMAVASTERISNWCVLWGREAREDRKVLILFAAKWMVYDRFNQLQFQEVHRTGVQPCGARLATGPPAGAAEPGPVPNTEYRSRPYRCDEALDGELALTDEALQWCEEAHRRREGLADDARA